MATRPVLIPFQNPLRAVTPSSGVKLIRVDRLIIGSGPSGLSSLTHLGQIPFRSRETRFDVPRVLLGSRGGIWPALAQTQPNLLMGQSGLFLEPDASKLTKAHQTQFMKAKDYAADLDRQVSQLLKQQKTLEVPGLALSVKKYDTNEFLITLQDGYQFVANNVMVASGPGDSQPLEDVAPVRNRPQTQRRQWPEDVSATQFLSGARAPKAGPIVIYGGGPSAAWAVDFLLGRANEVLWIADPDHGAFSTANPNNRNALLMKKAESLGILRLGKLEEAQFAKLLAPDDPTRPGLVLNIKDFTDMREGKADVSVPCSQIVLSTGTKRATALRILDPSLYGELAPIYSPASMKLDQVAIALATADHDCFVVGSTAFSDLVFRGLGSNATSLAEILPVAARPQDGIALSALRIAMLSEDSIARPNPRIADMRQLMKMVTDLVPSESERGAAEIAQAIIDERSRTDSTPQSLAGVIQETTGVDLGSNG